MTSKGSFERQISKPDTTAPTGDAIAGRVNELYQSEGSATANRSPELGGSDGRKSDLLPDVRLLDDREAQKSNLAEGLVSHPKLLAALVDSKSGLISEESATKALQSLGRKTDADSLEQLELLKQVIAHAKQSGRNVNPDELCRSCGIQLSLTGTSQKNLAVYLEHDPQLLRAITDHEGNLNKKFLDRVARSSEFQSPERQDVLRQLICSFDTIQSRDGAVNISSFFRFGGVHRHEIPADVSSAFEQLWRNPQLLKSITDDRGLVTMQTLEHAIDTGRLESYSKSAAIAESLLKNFHRLSSGGGTSGFINPDVIGRECGYHLSTTADARQNLLRYLNVDSALLSTLGSKESITEEAIEKALLLPANQTAQRLDSLRQLQDSFAHFANKKGVVDFSALRTSMPIDVNDEPNDGDRQVRSSGIVIFKDPDASDYYSLQGPPTISSEKIDKILSSRNSPASGLGKEIFEAGLKYGIDPAVALAFFAHESSFGTAGIAVENKSFGNFRDGKGGFKKYPNWQSSIEDWFGTMKNLYFRSKQQGGFGATSVKDIVPIYAPASDGNAPTSYIQTVQTMVRQWRSEQNSKA